MTIRSKTEDHQFTQTDTQDVAPPPCPAALLLFIYVLYLGMGTTESVPLFAKIDWMHEGERMGTVQIVLDGGLPIRDVYAPHGLFPEVIRPLFAFWLFGHSLASDRLLGLFLAPLAYVLAALYMWRLFTTPFWRIVALASFALFPLQILPRHILVFLTLVVLTEWFRDGNSRRLFFAGLITGLGYVFGTVDQTSFLLAAMLAFPVVLAIQQSLQRRTIRQASRPMGPSPLSVLGRIALPLYMGLLLGILPFAAYLGLTGTSGLFISDLFRRAEADAYALSHVMGFHSYPGMSMTNVLWYAVPTFYVCLSIWVLVQVALRGNRRWISIWPTLLFGIFSFAYALRHPNYWKLAVVAFPFVVGLVFVLSNLFGKETETSVPQLGGWTGRRAAIVYGFTAALMLLVLAHSLTREWKPKEVAPRFVFPPLALLVLGGIAVGRWGRIRSQVTAKTLLVGPPLAALIISVWFFNDAQPQVVGALTKKPRLVRDVVRLTGDSMSAGGRLTREQPQYFQDETLAYLKTASREDRRVVMLAPGAGIYYFLAALSPPNRFPEINITLADRWAQEVVDGLDRTRAELLVACDDKGEQMGGWPIKPVLSEYIASNYVDSGRQLNSELLVGCPFSVWVHRTPA